MKGVIERGSGLNATGDGPRAFDMGAVEERGWLYALADYLPWLFAFTYYFWLML